MIQDHIQALDDLVNPDDFLAIQLARYVAPQYPEVQTLVKRLVSGLSSGHTCLVLSSDELAVLSTYSHPALIREGNLLYLSRYAAYEVQLARDLKRLSAYTDTVISLADLTSYFTDVDQRQAAALALSKQLAIITGGPGTGKTTTVVKILALLLQQTPTLNITLAAPTGKAAMRLSESIVNSLNNAEVMRGFDAVLARIPTQAQTLHRLLGAKPFSVEFRHNMNNPLLEDVVVVDEASMIDLALMTKLVQSLKPTAKLILLGDKDQLASVESGAVLADCYQSLQHNRVELRHTYRFDDEIKALAFAVNQQQSDEVILLLKNAKPSSSIHWQQNERLLLSDLLAGYQAYIMQISQTNTDEEIINLFSVFNSFQLLTPIRHGKFGVVGLNQLVEKQLGIQGKWYAGRPVMIMQNDNNTQLYNGDVGLCLPSQRHQGQLRVFFQQGNTLRSFIPSRLPAHETSFAMTIHKSQGSEFGQVMIVLPDGMDGTKDSSDRVNYGQDVSLLTKELLYTAITRGKKRVSLMANEKVLREMIQANVSRNSGLANRLT